MKSFVAMLFLAVIALNGRADAGFLDLRYEGTLTAGSFDPWDNDLSGLDFKLDVIFETPAISSSPGEGRYVVTNIFATVAGSTYIEVDPSFFSVFLVDPTLSLPDDGVYIASLIGDGGFFPTYLTAKPTIAGEAPGPTIFSGYFGSLFNEVNILTSSGDYWTLVYDDDIGVAASITALPEPSSFALLSLGGLALAIGAYRRRTVAA